VCASMISSYSIVCVCDLLGVRLGANDSSKKSHVCGDPELQELFSDRGRDLIIRTQIASGDSTCLTVMLIQVPSLASSDILRRVVCCSCGFGERTATKTGLILVPSKRVLRRV